MPRQRQADALRGLLLALRFGDVLLYIKSAKRSNGYFELGRAKTRPDFRTCNRAMKKGFLVCVDRQFAPFGHAFAYNLTPVARLWLTQETEP